MATSPSLACERKGTSKELMQVMGHRQNQEGDNGGYKLKPQSPWKHKDYLLYEHSQTSPFHTVSQFPLWHLGFPHLVQSPQ